MRARARRLLGAPPFTRLDQVAQFVNASEGGAELGYMARMLALSRLPSSNIGNRMQHIRRNEPCTLHMATAGSAKLPVGNQRRASVAGRQSEGFQERHP